jgi:hypothetical protein
MTNTACRFLSVGSVSRGENAQNDPFARDIDAYL